MKPDAAGRSFSLRPHLRCRSAAVVVVVGGIVDAAVVADGGTSWSHPEAGRLELVSESASGYRWALRKLREVI